MEDMRLICHQCGRAFVFSENEQLQYSKRGFDLPRRCPDCRKHKMKINQDKAWEPKRRKQQRSRDYDEF